LQFLGQFLVEALDRRQFGHVDIGDFFQLAEAFGHQQLRQRFVDVEFFLEHLRTLGEFLLALLEASASVMMSMAEPVSWLRGARSGHGDRSPAKADRRAPPLRCGFPPRRSPRG
jgi:hypothetical protein